MLRDEIAISHEALDEHDVGQATDHLRSWLASRTTSSTRATFAHAAGPRPVNSARYVFLDPHARAFYADWDRAARDVAAILRYAAGRDPYDRDLSDLVGELSTQSEEFRSHWAAQNVRLHDTGVKDYHHPVVGDITLTYNRLDPLRRRGTEVHRLDRRTRIQIRRGAQPARQLGGHPRPSEPAHMSTRD
ncbi:MAG TPA: hypothetical protein VHF51_05695 [Solirubrobacteraceae bacterium]|nr:hypothetical protein [Solirubrobacteraceae bacterium]